MLRRFGVLALVLASIFGAVGSAGPAYARGARHAAMILDANTGQVLHNEDGDEQRHPASLTKMMTLYLAFETIEAGRMAMSDKIKISQEAASVAPSKLELEPGEEIAVSDAVKAIITKSANDIAVAVAEKVGGSQSNFVRLMNAKARELGMVKTHFENASGLPNEAQVTTARDMITLAMRLQDDFPKHYPLFAMREFRYNGASHRNHNTMLNSFQGIDGVKTGYTQKSGFNLVSSVHRGEKHLIGAVFGGSSAATRNGEMRVLLTRALIKASNVKTRKPMLIAKLKSLPKIAERPKAKPVTPQQVADVRPAPKPPLVSKPAQSAQLKPTAAIEPPTVEPVSAPADTAVVTVAAAPVIAEATPQPAAAPLEVFKVHRVMVAPRKSAKLPVPSPAETTDMAPEGPADEPPSEAPSTVAPAPRLALGQVAPSGNVMPVSIASLAAEAASDSETVVPKAAVARRPSVLDSKIAMLGAADSGVPIDAAPSPPTAAVTATPSPAESAKPLPVVAPQAAPQPKPASASAPVAKPIIAKTATTAAIAPRASQPASPKAALAPRGLPPSTLQAQAATLIPPAAKPQRVASLQQTAGQTAAPQTAAPKGRFEIQIGAYASADEAQRNISTVQNKAGKLLTNYPSVTYPIQKAGRQIVRARFRGFDAQSASNTCAELRSKAIDCFVMTAE